MSAISIKPKQSIHLLLNKAYNMNNPRLSIRLEESVLNDEDDDKNENGEDDDENEDDEDNALLMFQNQYKCQSCDSLKKMLLLRDRTIVKLIEDRDQLKIKLTKAMNQNIEFSRQLIKYQHLSSQLPSKKNKQTATDQTCEKVFHELDFYKKRCHELEDINQHLKHHLYSLRNAFAELGNVDDEYQDLPSCSDTLSSSTAVRNNDDCEYNDDVPESSSTVLPNPLSSTTFVTQDSRPANNAKLTYHQPKVVCECDFEHETKTTIAQQRETIPVVIQSDPSLTSKSPKVKTQHPVVASTITTTIQPVTEPSPSNFDLWYNS